MTPLHLRPSMLLTIAVVIATLSLPGRAADRPVDARSGIPFGAFHLPSERFAPPFTGAYWRPNERTALAYLGAAQRAGMRVILNLSGSRDTYRRQDGTFDLERWKHNVERFRSVDVRPFLADGTLLGHYLLDEPNARLKWNGAPVPLAEIEAAAAYSKSLWPDMPTFVRAHPDFLDGYAWKHLDAAWAQFTMRQVDAKTYLERHVASARRQGLGLVMGLDLFTGGTPEGGVPSINGKWAMTGAQIEAWGSRFAAEPYACALILWKYDPDRAGYFARPDVQTALRELGRVSADRASASCRSRARTTAHQREGSDRDGTHDRTVPRPLHR